MSLTSTSQPKPGNASLAYSLAQLPESQRTQYLQSLTDRQVIALLYDWPFFARPGQIAPEGDWSFWVAMAGRGWGKTRVGAEWVRAQVESGRCKRLALVAPTAADVRDVMIEGESGLLAISRPDFMPTFESSRRRVTWPNGAIATTYSAEKPDSLRGPQHDGAWCDELASWRFCEDAWSMLMFGLRLGVDPRCVVTTTPRPVRVLKTLLANPHTVVTSGTTYDNRENLARTFYEQIVRQYEGTRLGRQELMAELLEDVPGALWSHAMLDPLRVAQVPDLSRVVVAIDPGIKEADAAAETGIIVAGTDENGEGYVIEDATTRSSPALWGQVAVEAYHRHEADRIVAEANNGGNMIQHVLRTVDPSVPVRLVNASRGKVTRAEPIAALYEQGRVHHFGTFAHLEDQMCSYTGDPGETSPDRMDALVWALSELMLKRRAKRAASSRSG